MSEAAATDKQWFGHPRGLSTLFFTEMWERFSYYGLRGILLLYLVNETDGLGMSDELGTAIVGAYLASVYLLALPGGWIADQLIGQRRAVLVGGIIIALGHFSMAVPLTITFFLGLGLIAVGTGLLKPNVSAIVGDLYPPDAPERRDAGFSIFYMGINIGAMIGPLLCGYLGENISWHLGFSAAGFGMTFGVIQYWLGAKHLSGAGELATDDAAIAGRADAKVTLYKGIGAIAAVVLLVWGVDAAGLLDVTFLGIVDSLGYVIGGGALLFFAYLLIFGDLEQDEKRRVGGILVLFVGATLFWAGFEQASSSMTLFAERGTDRMIGGWEMPTSWLQAVNPLFIILLAPVFAGIWVRLGERDPSIPVKFGLGLVQLGIGFFVVAWGAVYTVNNPSGVSPAWLVVAYFFHTTGELCLSPVGLSSVTKLSPRRYVGQMMGIWFMATSLGNLVAGRVAGQIEDLTMSQLFTAVATAVVVGGLLLLAFSPGLKKLTHTTAADAS